MACTALFDQLRARGAVMQELDTTSFRSSASKILVRGRGYAALSAVGARLQSAVGECRAKVRQKWRLRLAASCPGVA